MIRYDRCILSVTDNVRSADLFLRITEYVIQPFFILCCFAASICFTPPINHLWYIFTLILVPNETSSCFLITFIYATVCVNYSQVLHSFQSIFRLRNLILPFSQFNRAFFVQFSTAPMHTFALYFRNSIAILICLL